MYQSIISRLFQLQKMDRQFSLGGESLCVWGALWKGGKEINNLKIQFWSNELRADVMMGSMQELQVGQRETTRWNLFATQAKIILFSVWLITTNNDPLQSAFLSQHSSHWIVFSLRYFSLWALNSMVWANWTISRHLSYWGWSCKASNC